MRGFPPLPCYPPHKLIRFDPFVNGIVVILINFIDFVFRKKQNLFISPFLPCKSFSFSPFFFFSLLLFSFLFLLSFLPLTPSFSLFPYPSFFQVGRLIFPLGASEGALLPLPPPSPQPPPHPRCYATVYSHIDDKPDCIVLRVFSQYIITDYPKESALILVKLSMLIIT